MYANISFSDFLDYFHGHDRDSQFSYEGKRALFDYLESVEEDTGEKIELDVIALCCEYTEYDNLEALQAEYPDIKDMDDLADHTTVIPIEGKDSFIIQQF